MWVCVCVYVCACVCVYVISITQKQIAAETSNVVFYICIVHRCYLKHFIKIGQKLCVQEHTKNSKTLRLMDGISCWWIFLYLDCGKYKEIQTCVSYDHKHVNYRIWNKLQAWLIYRPTQNISDMWMTMARNCRNFICCYFMQFLNELS